MKIPTVATRHTQIRPAIESSPCIDMRALCAEAEAKLDRKVMARYAKAQKVRLVMILLRALPKSTWEKKFFLTTSLDRQTTRNMRIADLVEEVKGGKPWTNAPFLIGHHLEQARELVEDRYQALERELEFRSPIEEVRAIVIGFLPALRYRLDPVFVAVSLEIDPQRVFEGYFDKPSGGTGL